MTEKVQIPDAVRVTIPKKRNGKGHFAKTAPTSEDPVASLSQGHPGFMKLVEELKQLHLSKSADYGTEEDPLANLREAAQMGYQPWHFAVAEASCAFFRVKTFLRKNQLKNESVENALLDAANFCLLALALRREEAK